MINKPQIFALVISAVSLAISLYNIGYTVGRMHH